MTATASPSDPRSIDRARIRRLDILGGTRPLAFVLGLTALIVVVDLLCLRFIYGLSQAYFVDFFGDPTGDGGFAAVFLLIFGAVLVLSHVCFRRSLWFGWIFLMLCLSIQALIGVHGHITEFFGALQRASANDVFSGGVVAFLIATWEGASRLLVSHYDPVRDAVRLGIGEGFARSLVLNSMLLIGAVGLVPVVALLGLVLGWIGRRAGLVEPRADAHSRHIRGYFPLLGMERTIAVYAGIGALLFAAAAPMLVLFIPGSKQNAGELENIVWIGPLVVMLEMARLALYRGPDTPPAAEDAQGSEDSRLIPRVHDYLLKTLRRKHAALVIPAAAAGLAGLHEASADAGDAAQPSGLRYFLETLTPLHFFRLSTLLASTALDRGRSALIVCPAAVKPEVIARFQAARGIGERSAGEQWVELNTQNPDRNVPIDVIVAAPEEIETLLVRSQDYREDLRRLGAIFVLNLDRTDPGLLGINLRRLRNASSHPNDLVYIAQSEPLIDQENRIQQSLPRTSAARIRSDLELAGKTNRYISIWLPEAEDSIDDPAHWPVEIQAILAAKEVDPAVEPFLWDMRRSYLSNHWHTVLPPLLREQNREALVPVVRDLAPERLGPRPGKNTVAVVAGHGNLADALSLSFANGEADDALCVIAMMDYPLARFHFDRFRTSVVNAQRSDISSREALRLFRNAYAAMSPKPNTGPVELALMLANEFLVANQAALSDPNRGWLSQSAIEEFWQGEPAEALRQLRINTTKTGLVRLFRLCVGHTIRIEQQRAANLVRRYRLQNPRQIEGATVSRLAIRTPSLELGSIPEADHGLSYAKDTTIIVGAALYHVSDVDSAKQCLWVMEADGNEPRFAFVRSYAIVRAWRRGDPADADETHDIAVDAYFQERNKRVPFELANGYIRVARRTSLAYRYAGPVTPFLGEERGPQSLPCHVPQPARLRSAALLRLFHDGAGTRPPRRTGADRGANRQEACVAFTLATTLQDTLASLFPAHAHRIAVVSPQAAGIETDLDANGRGLDPRTRFALDRQPVLAELDPQRLAVDPEDAKRRCRLSADATRAYERYVGQFFDQARDISQVPVAPGATRMFSFIVIEDSDHDLGIARVFVERREHVFRIWEEFLDHCVRTATSPDDNPYDFHSGKVSEAFRFQPALDVVRNMRRN